MADSVCGLPRGAVPAREAVRRATLWTRARAVYRRGGLRDLWFGVLGATVYRRLLLLDRSLERPAPRVASESGLEVVLLEDEHAYHRFRPDTPAGEFARRTAGGSLCHAALLGGRVVGATWAYPGRGHSSYLGTDVRCEDDEIYLADTQVVSELRGRRVAPAIAAEQIRWFERAGYRRMIVTVLPENRASLRARRRAGFEIYGMIGRLGLGRFGWHFERRLRRRFPG